MDIIHIIVLDIVYGIKLNIVFTFHEINSSMPKQLLFNDKYDLLIYSRYAHSHIKFEKTLPINIFPSYGFVYGQ